MKWSIMLVDSRRDSQVIFLSFISFVGLGCTSGLLGLAWPSIRQQFGLQQDAMGLMLIGNTIGYMTSSFFNGRIMIGFGTARAMVAGAILLSLGMLGIGLAPLWPLMIAATVVGGFGSGIIDAGMNNYVSSYYNARQMNWLHASFGVGWVFGTWFMTRFLERALPWQLGYLTASAINVGLIVMFLVSARMWRNGLPQQGMKEGAVHARMSETLRLPMLWLSLALILTYVGLEASPSTWAYTIFTEARGLAPGLAGNVVTLSLATFTIGRIFFGFVGDHVSRNMLLRLCMIGSGIGALLLWWSPTEWLGFGGLLLLTFAQAPMFALLILGTSERVGARHTASAIGVQVSAAGAGFAVIPAIGGIIAQQISLEALLPFFVLLAVAIYVLNEAAIIGAARVNAVERVPVTGD